MLTMSAHARERWMKRAPRCLRTRGAMRDACRYAVCHGTDPTTGNTLYVALGMILVVRGGSVVTVVRSPGSARTARMLRASAR